jgi:hypothetical protein
MAVGAHFAFNQTFMPAKIADEIMRGWFCFLLSGFDKKFKPEMSRSIEMPSEELCRAKEQNASLRSH